MAEDAVELPDSGQVADQPAKFSAAAPICGPFFGPTDWLGFGLTSTLMLAVYLFTLSPEIGLENSGIFVTGATYAGVPHPPGFPAWTIYAWLFTKLIPFSNMAWRVALSSAVAGALACGVIGLMVSRAGGMLVAGMRGCEHRDARNEQLIRLISGCVAGLAFGLDEAVWSKAVIADPWLLTFLLFGLVLCLLLRWHYAPERSRYLYAALFMYGLTLCCSMSLVVAALGLEFIILSARLALGRDFLAATTLLLVVTFCFLVPGSLSDLVTALRSRSLTSVIGWLASFTLAMSFGLGMATRGMFSNWKMVVKGYACVAAGLSLYFYEPIASMTNPPMNWSYPRKVEGFFHLISRGQYERLNPTGDLARFAEQIGCYFERCAHDLGTIYFVLSLVPFCWVLRMRWQERRWLFGLLGVYLFLSLFLAAMMNASPDLQSRELSAQYFAASHIVLAIWAGCGLVLVGMAIVTGKVPGPTGKVSNESESG